MPDGGQAPYTYFVRTLPGMEQVTWLEIRSRFPGANFREHVYARNQYGGVVFDYGGATEDLAVLRTAEAAFVVVLWMPKLSRSWQDLRAIGDQLEKRGELGRVLKLMGRLRRRHLNSYQVLPEKHGKHQYSLRDWSQSVRDRITRLYPDWRGTTREPDLEISATILGSQAVIGVRLPWPAPPQAAFPRALAAGLVTLTEPGREDVFLDPVCGAGGLVLAERLAVGGSTAVWAAERFGSCADQVPAEAQDDFTRYAWENGRLPVGDASVDKLAMILPDVPGDIARSYREVLRESGRLLAGRGRAALFTHHYDLVRDLLRDELRLELASGYSVLVNERWGRIYTLQPA